EHLVGLLLSFGISLGALVIAAGPARGHVKTRAQGAALYLLCSVWALCAAYPIVHGLYPGKPFASGKLGEDGSEVTLQAPDGGKSIYINGKLRGGGDVDAPFQISGHWQGGQGAVNGSLSRNVARVRVGRR